jgi:hypothetical protein
MSDFSKHKNVGKTRKRIKSSDTENSVEQSDQSDNSEPDPFKKPRTSHTDSTKKKIIKKKTNNKPKNKLVEHIPFQFSMNDIVNLMDQRYEAKMEQIQSAKKHQKWKERAKTVKKKLEFETHHENHPNGPTISKIN